MVVVPRINVRTNAVSILLPSLRQIRKNKELIEAVIAAGKVNTMSMAFGN